jgi:hypothetical protein
MLTVAYLEVQVKVSTRGKQTSYVWEGETRNYSLSVKLPELINMRKLRQAAKCAERTLVLDLDLGVEV